MKDITLFCLPFAGGTKYSYREFVKLAPHNIDIFPVEIPGRGTRTNEALLEDCELVVGDILNQISDKLDQPYAIYGHSMGTLLGYELTKKIIKDELNKPVHLFCSSGAGPSMRGYRPNYHDLPQAEFFDKIRKLGGLPAEISEDESLLSYFEPILRADFKVTETYKYQRQGPFDIPITIMIGSDETIKKETALAWQLETSHKLEFFEFVGDHFFIFDHTFQMMQLISSRLSQSLFSMK